MQTGEKKVNFVGFQTREFIEYGKGCKNDVSIRTVRAILIMAAEESQSAKNGKERKVFSTFFRGH
jgi:hypothetical protein